MGRARVDVGEALGQAQRTLTAHLRPFVVVTLGQGLPLLLAMTPQWVVFVSELAGRPLDPELALPLQLGGGVVSKVVAEVGSLWLAGLALVALRRGEVRAGEPRGLLGRALGVVIPCLAATVLAEKLATLGLFLCIVPAFVLLAGFAFAPLLVLDKGLGPIAALQASWRITLGARWAVLGLQLLTPLVALSGLILLGAGVLVTVPLASLAWVAAYEQAWPWAGPRVGVVPARRWLGQPKPADPAACVRCDGPADQGSHTCAGCGARYHAACLTARCLVSGCSQTWPVHQDWTVEDRSQGPWIQVPALPVSMWTRVVLLGAVLVWTAVFDLDMAETLVGVVAHALPAAWMAWSATAGLVLVPFAVALLLLFHEHRSHRGALLDRHGLLLDFGPDWPGTRWAWRDLAGFELEERGVWVRSGLRRFSAVLLAVPEAERTRVVELLEAHKVPRVDA